MGPRNRISKPIIFLLFSILAIDIDKVGAQVIIADALPGCLNVVNINAVDCGNPGNTPIQVIANQVVVNNAEGTACTCNLGLGNNNGYFEFEVVDISNFTGVSISLDYSASNTSFENETGGVPALDCGTDNVNMGHDQIVFYYSLDGGPFVQSLAVMGTTQFDFTGVWNVAGLTGNTLTIRVLASNKANAEFFYLDNLVIEGTPNYSAGPDLSGCAGSTVNLMGSGNGSWTGGLGTFSNPNSPTSTYTIDPSEAGTVTLTFSPPNTASSCVVSGDQMDITINSVSGILSGGGDLCPGECADVLVSFTGGTPPYTLDLSFSTPSLPIPFPFTVPGFGINDVITVCYGTSGTFPSFNAATNTLTLPPFVAGLSGTMNLLSISDSGGCTDVPQSSNVSFLFRIPPVAVPASMEVCDEGAGFGVFDFTTLENTILNGTPGGFVTFYDNVSLTSQIFPPYIGPSTTIYAVVTDANGCDSEPVELELIVLDSGDAGIVTATCNGGQSICTVCDEDGVPGEDIQIDFTFENPNINYTIDIVYFVNGQQNNFTGTLPGTGGSFTFNITGDAVFSIIGITAEGDCLDNTDLPLAINFEYLVQPTILNSGSISSCTPVTLPDITGINLTGNQYYNTEPLGTGTTLFPGAVISNSTTLYAIDGIVPDCFTAEEITITIGSSTTLIPPASDTICGYYILPIPPGQSQNTTVGYYTELGGMGNNLAIGDTLFVSDSLYLFDPNSNCPSNDTFFYINISGQIQYDSLGIIEGCDELILPPIQGSGFGDSVRYYTGINGSGISYQIGDTVTFSDTLYYYDPTSLCPQDTQYIVTAVTPGIRYNQFGGVNQCEFLVLPNIGGTNVLPTAMFFTLPNGGGVGYRPGDTLRASTTLYIFDTTTVCNINQPSFVVNIGQKPLYDLPFFVTTCGSYDLPVITGTNLTGNDSYYSGPFGSGTLIPAGTIFTSDTTIYIYSGPTQCQTNKEIRISFDEFLGGTPENIGICSNQGTFNLFDAILPPYTSGGTWEELGPGGTFDLTDPNDVPIPANLMSGIYPFRYVLSSPECGVLSTAVQIEIINSPAVSNDTMVNICNGASAFDLATIYNVNAQNITVKNEGNSIPISGSTVDLSSVTTGVYDFKVIASNSGNLATCTDSLSISLNISDGPNAGDNIISGQCIGAFTNLTSLLFNNSEVGRFEFQNGNNAVPNIIDTETYGVGTFRFLHIIDGQGLCGSDTAVITLNIQDQPFAGRDSVVSDCRIGDYILTDFISTNTPSGNFRLLSGPGSITNSTLSVTQPGSYRVAYIVGNGMPCPRDTAILNINVNATKTGSFADETCYDTYTVAGVTLTRQNPSQMVTLTSAENCDSIVTIDITFSDILEGQYIDQICPGSAITLNGVVYDENKLSGRDTLSGGASSGCDSVVNVMLTLLQPSIATFAATSCNPSYSVTVGNTTFNQSNPSGTATFVGMAANGCDSIVNVNLVIEPFNASYDIVQPECEEENGIFNITQFSGTDTLVISGDINAIITANDLPFSNELAPGNTYTINVSTIDGECDTDFDLPILEVTPFEGEIVATALSDTTWQLGVDASSVLTAYFWTNVGGSLSCWDCPDPIFTGTQGLVTVIFDYGNACTSFDSISLETEINDDFFLPNVFSPDKNGINDNFTLSVDDNSTLWVDQFVVFDRWGNVMTKLENVKAENGMVLWDGKLDNTEVLPGVYVYQLILDSIGGRKIRRGEITVIR